MPHYVLDAMFRWNKSEGLEPAVKHKQPLCAENRQRQVYFEDVMNGNNVNTCGTGYFSYRDESTGSDGQLKYAE